MTQSTEFDRLKLALLALLISLVLTIPMCAYGAVPEGVLQAIAVDPTEPNRVYAAGNGRVYASMDGGVSWTESDERFVAWSLLVQPSDAVTGPDEVPVVIAGTEERGVMLSTKEGGNWSAAPGLAGKIGSVASSNDGHSLFAAGNGVVYHSNDMANNWEVIGDFPAGTPIYGLAVDPTNPNIIYAGKWGDGVFISVDGGASWSLGNLGLFDTQIFDLDIDPTNPSVIYVSTPSGVFQSVDGGLNWSRMMSPFLVNEMAIDPTNSNRMYAVTEDTGIYRTTDGGLNWFPVTLGLEGVTAFTSIAVSPDGVIYAGSAGSGLFVSADRGFNWSRVVEDTMADEPPPGPIPPPPAQPPPVTDSTSLTIEIVDRHNGESVAAGNKARFRIKVRNVGEHVARNVVVDAYWVRTRLINSNDAMSFTISTSQGHCPIRFECYLGNLPVGAERIVEFRGDTKAGALGWYRLIAGAEAENAVRNSRTMEKGSSVTVFESGGGSIGPVFAILLLLLLRRRLAVA